MSNSERDPVRAALADKAAISLAEILAQSVSMEILVESGTRYIFSEEQIAIARAALAEAQSNAHLPTRSNPTVGTPRPSHERLREPSLVDPGRPACGQRDEWGRKPTDEGFSNAAPPPTLNSGAVEQIRAALFEPEESDAYDNLDGALIDIERLSEQDKPTDEVCIRTIRRVLTQLNAVHNIIAALSHLQAGDGLGPTHKKFEDTFSAQTVVLEAIRNGEFTDLPPLGDSRRSALPRAVDDGAGERDIAEILQGFHSGKLSSSEATDAILALPRAGAVREATEGK